MNRFRALVLAGVFALAPTSAWATCGVAKLFELQTVMEGTKPMVTVGINGHDERFLADSGAFYSNISAGKAAELGLKLRDVGFGVTMRGIGGEVHPSLTTVQTVRIGALELHNITFVVGGSEVGSGAGLLGQNVLGVADVEYDLAHGAIRLMRAKDCKDAVPVYWTSDKPVSIVPILPPDPRNPHTIGTVLVNGVKLRAMFDTGAGSTVMSLAAAAKAGIRPDSPGVVAAGYSHGIGSRTVAAYVVLVDSIKLGDQEVIYRTRLRAEAADLPGADMLIGADFFLSHRVYVANGLHKLFFTYNGGPIFSTKAGRTVDEQGRSVTIAADAEADPTDAESYSRRGAAFMARRDYPHALADFDKAVAMAPNEARYVFQRGQARAATRQPLLAMDDLDKTLALDPANAEARLLRASVRLARHDRAAAEEDVASVDTAAAPAADARLTLAGMYDRLDRYDRALAQYDLWLRYHPEDSRKPGALNGRCWARAQLGQDLPKALTDCDAAVKARPDAASYLDSRALVRLRMGDNDRALRDYDAALALQPKMAWSLYGRGIAEQRLGRQDQAKKDMDAAIAADAGVTARAKRLGLSS